jgi:hypothetical protein
MAADITPEALQALGHTSAEEAIDQMDAYENALDLYAQNVQDTVWEMHGKGDRTPEMDRDEDIAITAYKATLEAAGFLAAYLAVD